MDSNLYTANEIKLIKEKVGLDKDGFITPYAIRGTLKMNFTNKHYLFNIPLDEISLNICINETYENESKRYNKK